MEGTCPHPQFWKPTQEELQRIVSDHRQWLEGLKGQGPQKGTGLANLCNADLTGVDLSKDDLTFAYLQGAWLLGAKLNGTILQNAHLNKADLRLAKLNRANLVNTELNGANLLVAELAGADLSHTQLAGAQLAFTNLTDAIYAPASAPPDSYVGGIRGLSTVTFPGDDVTGLVQLRDLLQKAGLRDLESEVTFAIESGKTKYLLNGKNPVGAAGGIFRYVAFDLTTAYGLKPRRALQLIAALWALLIPIYAWPIWRSKRPPGASSIYRIWPKERVEVRENQPTFENPARIERLHGRGLVAVTWSAISRSCPRSRSDIASSASARGSLARSRAILR